MAVLLPSALPSSFILARPGQRVKFRLRNASGAELAAAGARGHLAVSKMLQFLIAGSDPIVQNLRSCFLSCRSDGLMQFFYNVLPLFSCCIAVLLLSLAFVLLVLHPGAYCMEGWCNDLDCIFCSDESPARLIPIPQCNVLSSRTVNMVRRRRQVSYQVSISRLIQVHTPSPIVECWDGRVCRWRRAVRPCELDYVIDGRGTRLRKVLLSFGRLLVVVERLMRRRRGEGGGGRLRISTAAVAAGSRRSSVHVSV
ncbi:hypothetical protein LSTR_LSTR011259 [Laodelphax striatellus]|uniref:Uncharacterized protein n=1 Tax=Laodelphax striatellus TaxID=195883 RepID=A0A482WT81_LAOST|nr:hypothetical protein LSTR_LSTR011259 [Laodelphax striatellus]